MTVSQTALNGIQNTPVLRSSGVSEIDPNVSALREKIANDYKCFIDDHDYTKKRNTLLGFLNSILGKTYSFGTNGLPIEKIFDDNKLGNNDKICNAGKKAYAYYLKEVLQKLNLLNEHILKGQETLDALKNCTDEAQINKCKTTLEIEDELVKKYLNDFNKYTVVQTLATTRSTIRNNINNILVTIPSGNSVEVNYETRGKIWNEDGTETGKFAAALGALNSLQNLRDLKTVKESGTQLITTILTNKYTGDITNLNDEFGFNVVDKKIPQESISKETSPIALFDELTLLEKLKYIRVYYAQNTNSYHYPEDLKSGIPCMSRDELVQYTPEGKDDELIALGIIPSKENAPKADLVEPGAVELFYVGYLEDSQGAINALAAFMEIKSVALMTQITQQSYRIKALKTYLKMLEFGLQELNSGFKKECKSISPKAYLAIKYAAANQTRTLVNINGEDYIVLQLDGEQETGKYEHYNLSDNNAYIYVKATEAGIDEFLSLEWKSVDMVFKSQTDPSFRQLSNDQIKNGYRNKTIFGEAPNFSHELDDYDYFYKTAKVSETYIIDIERYSDGTINRYQRDGGHYINTRGHTPWLYEQDVATNDHRLIYDTELGKEIASIDYYYIYYYKKDYSSEATLTSQTGNILFANFKDKDDSDDIAKAKTIEYLPKELETVKVKMDTILVERFGGEEINWKKKNDDYKDQWINLVEMWQNVCQTAIENIGSQIDSVNKTIKSLRSKIDTFDSSANRFRDKFYSTTMTVLNKLS